MSLDLQEQVYSHYNHLINLKQKDNNFILSLENKKVIKFLNKIIEIKKNFKNFKVQNLIYEIIKKFQFLDYFSKENEVKNIYDFYLLTNSYLSVLDLLKMKKVGYKDENRKIIRRVEKRSTE